LDHQLPTKLGEALEGPSAVSGVELPPQTHIGEVLASKTFLVAAIFTILMYKIATDGQSGAFDSR